MTDKLTAMDEPPEPDDSDYDYWGSSREEYEQSLGKFLVSFNRIENIVSELLARALARGGRSDLVDRAIKRPLDRRLDDLELLLVAYPDAPKPPYADIRQLSYRRNELAHGHYDDWQGYQSFNIVSRGKRNSLPPSEITPLVEQAEELAFRLRRLEAHWDFEQVREAVAEVEPPK